MLIFFLLIHKNEFLAIYYNIISGSSDLISSLPRWIHCLIDFSIFQDLCYYCSLLYCFVMQQMNIYIIMDTHLMQFRYLT